MIPFMALALPVLLSAVAVFVLTMVIHMTPWHRGDYRKLPDESGVMAALRPFNIPAGDYLTPHPGTGKEMQSPEYDAKRAAGPVTVLTVIPNGPWKIGRMMAFYFGFTFLVSASVAHLVGMIVPPGGDLHLVFHQAAISAWLAYAMGGVPISIWYDRRWATTFRNAADAILYALATGAIFMLMWPKM